MTYKTYSFEKLEVWQLARLLKKEIYKATYAFPKEELYGLTSQIRRSSSSITTNLEEGSGRASNVDKAHFTNIAYSSALETIDHLMTGFDLEFLGENDYVDFRHRLDLIIAKLNGLYRYQLNDEESLKKKLRK